MNYNIVYKTIETVRGENKQVLDTHTTLKNLTNALKNVKGGNINQAQVNGLIEDSQKKTREMAELKTQITKISNDNRKLSNNLVKLLKRLEKLEKDDSTSASIPEF